MPPRPLPLFAKHRTGEHIPRVATLQMIQQHGSFDEETARPTTESEKEPDVPEIEKEDTKSSDSSVYVVYPVNMAVNIDSSGAEEMDESVVIGTHGPHRPLPPDTLEGEKMEEKPLLVPSEQDPESQDALEDKDANFNIIPYLQDYAPSTPITLVYTPTSQTVNQDTDDKPVQNFIAPFVASESAEAPVNGWSVVTLAKDKAAEEKKPESVITTEFDPDSFKPVFESGFKPIYEFASDNETNGDGHVVKPDMPRSMPDD